MTTLATLTRRTYINDPVAPAGHIVVSAHSKGGDYFRVWVDGSFADRAALVAGLTALEEAGSFRDIDGITRALPDEWRLYRTVPGIRPVEYATWVSPRIKAMLAAA